jgi:hypothetical protein
MLLRIVALYVLVFSGWSRLAQTAAIRQTRRYKSLPCGEMYRGWTASESAKHYRVPCCPGRGEFKIWGSATRSSSTKC